MSWFFLFLWHMVSNLLICVLLIVQIDSYIFPYVVISPIGLLTTTRLPHLTPVPIASLSRVMVSLYCVLSSYCYWTQTFHSFCINTVLLTPLRPQLQYWLHYLGNSSLMPSGLKSIRDSILKLTTLCSLSCYSLLLPNSTLLLSITLHGWHWRPGR